jgi:hypothetical protein
MGNREWEIGRSQEADILHGWQRIWERMKRMDRRRQKTEF